MSQTPSTNDRYLSGIGAMMIKFDLDGVLIDLHSMFELLMNRDGYEIVPNGKFQFETSPKLSNDEIWDYIKKAYLYTDVIPLQPFAKRLLREVYCYTTEPISILTARPLSAANHTYKVADRLMDGIPYTIALIPNPADKVFHLAPNDVIIEDRRRTVLQLAEIGIHSVLVDMPYNKLKDPAPAEILQVPDLEHIIPLIPALCDLKV